MSEGYGSRYDAKAERKAERAATTMTPMSEERLREIETEKVHYLAVALSQRHELLAEIHRLRTLPPEVAEAMGRYAADPERTSELHTIANYFTALFKKGA